MNKAVITGDIIASTKLTTKDREWLTSALKKTLKKWDRDFERKSEIKGSKQTIAMRTNDEYNDEFETEMVLLDYIISRTTALQCEVVNLKLLDYTETKIANILNIQQSAVNQRSNSGGWYAIEKMVKRFEIIYG